MRKRRVISKSKTYGFNPWMDQIDAINQIMRETDEKTESVLLRKLVDEALAARRKKGESLPEESDNELGGRTRTIESLLVRLVRQGDTSLRIHDLCLALIQDVLAETHAIQRISWDSLVTPQLRLKGLEDNQIEHQFRLQTDQAKDYAYGLAEQIKQSQEPAT